MVNTKLISQRDFEDISMRSALDSGGENKNVVLNFSGEVFWQKFRRKQSKMEDFLF
jgi:hypothetical protein